LLLDHSVGFGGKYGIQKDRQDKSAVGWDYKEQLQSHKSQKGMMLNNAQIFTNSVLNISLDYSKGFGGKYGVDADKQDKSALGWDHIEKVPLHDSQTGICSKIG